MVIADVFQMQYRQITHGIIAMLCPDTQENPLERMGQTLYS